MRPHSGNWSGWNCCLTSILVVEQKNPNASLFVRINDRKKHIRLSNELADHVLVRGR